jgi:hypothetical protein
MRIAIVILATIFIVFPTVKNGHAYLDAQAAYVMALRHHNQAGKGKRNYHIAMLLYCRADADGQSYGHKWCLAFSSSGDQIEFCHLHTVFELYSGHHLGQVVEAA